jgi:hypothetical protein
MDWKSRLKELATQAQSVSDTAVSIEGRPDAVNFLMFCSPQRILDLFKDAAGLPPLGNGYRADVVTMITAQQRAKWKKQWAKMDDEYCQPQHYKHYEWECRKVFEELERREEQLAALLAQKEALEKELGKYTPEFLNEGIRKAAQEITGAFDVTVPRGRQYVNTVRETIAIIIAQNLKGIYREAPHEAK